MEYTPGKIWTITYPVLISLLMQQLIGLTDTAFMGRVGEVELGASAIAGVYYLVIYMIGFGFSVGAEIVMGRLNGEKKFKEIGRIFFHGMTVLLALAAIIFTASKFITPWILGASVSSKAIYEASIRYMDWRIYGLFFSFAGIMFRAYFMAITKTKILTINSLVMVGSNVLLNYILIFGKLGFPALGIAGAAIASSVSEAISLIFYVVYTRLRTNHQRYGLFRLYPYSFKVQNRIFRIASWTMVQYFVSCGTWLFFFIAIEHLGEASLAISNMVRSIGSLMYLFVSAFATAGSAMVSNLMGKGLTGNVIPLANRIVRMCALCTLPILLFTLLFPGLVLRIYTNDPALIASAVPSLYYMTVSYVFGIPAYVYFLAISGTGNTRAAFWIEIAILVFYTGYTYFMTFVVEADVKYVWTVETLYGLLLLVLSRWYLAWPGWKLKTV